MGFRNTEKYILEHIVSYCLKGHTIEISSFYADENNHNLLMSGSCDTQVKIWDLRTKNYLHNLKNHKNKIISLKISSCSRYFFSGGEDGILNNFDIRIYRNVFQYDLNSPVLTIDCSQDYLAIGCADRQGRVYEFPTPFNYIGTTKNEAMPVSNCVFYENNFLFTAGTDHMKLYDLS